MLGTHAHRCKLSAESARRHASRWPHWLWPCGSCHGSTSSFCHTLHQYMARKTASSLSTSSVRTRSLIQCVWLQWRCKFCFVVHGRRTETTFQIDSICCCRYLGNGFLCILAGWTIVLLSWEVLGYIIAHQHSREAFATGRARWRRAPCIAVAMAEAFRLR